MADDASLVLTPAPAPAPVPTITKLPMLQDFRRDAMTLLWETDANLANHSVEWGPSGGLLSNVVTRVETTQVDATHFVHKATLTGLSTQTAYDYRVVSGPTASCGIAVATASAWPTCCRKA